MKLLKRTLTVLVVLMVSVVWGVGLAGAETKGHKGAMERKGPHKEKGTEQKMLGMEQMKGMEAASEESYGDGPFDIEAMKERLKLTADQVAKLKKLRADYRKTLIKRRADHRVAELDLWELIDTDKLDMEKAEKKVREVEAIQADIMLYRIKTLQETKRFLTDEQYEQFREMGFKAMKRMMGRYGRGQGMGHGMGQGKGHGMGQGMEMPGGGQHEE